MPICRYFYGSDGTRTRDLRRDRLVPPIRRWATIDALSLYSYASAGPLRSFAHVRVGSISCVCCPSAAQTCKLWSSAMSVFERALAVSGARWPPARHQARARSPGLAPTHRGMIAVGRRGCDATYRQLAAPSSIVFGDHRSHGRNRTREAPACSLLIGRSRPAAMAAG